MVCNKKKDVYKYVFLFSILTLFFSIVIFLCKNFYFDYDITLNQSIEEKYIEPISLFSATEKEKSEKKKPLNLSTIIKKEEKLKYSYIPNSYKKEKELKLYRILLNVFFNYEPVDKKITKLDIFLHKHKVNTRGKLKNGKIHMFDALVLSKKEFLAVAIHEFGHYLDLYILKKQVHRDISEYFYGISWNTPLVLKTKQDSHDFVSGYAMTNQYEDFAESFSYYILHNESFLHKTKNSKILQAKYNFFSNYVFTKGEFKDFKDGNKEKIKSYYWDITKIDFDIYNFLHYMKTVQDF